MNESKMSEKRLFAQKVRNNGSQIADGSGMINDESRNATDPQNFVTGLSVNSSVNMSNQKLDP